MAERQIILEKTTEFGWVEDRLMVEIQGIYDTVNRIYVPGWTRSTQMIKYYLEGIVNEEGAGITKGSTIIQRLVYHPAVDNRGRVELGNRAILIPEYYTFTFHERYLTRRLAKWFEVPVPRTTADILDYNQTVLALMIQSTLSVGWGAVMSTWWERLVALYELSDETQQMAMQFVDEFIKDETTRLETENPLLFGFDKYDLGEYFGISVRAALALIRLVLNRPIMADYPLLEPIAGRTDVGWGLRHLMEHPKGSHYSGDFNVEDVIGNMDPAMIFGMVLSGGLGFAGAPIWLAGAFPAGLTISSVIEDILRDDFSMGTIVKIAGVFLYAWGAAVQLTVVQQVVPKVVSDSVKLSVSSTAAGITAEQTLASGNTSLMQKMTSALGLVTALTGVAAYNIFSASQKSLLNALGKMTGYVGEATGYASMFDTAGRPIGLPQVSTVSNPTGYPVGFNPVGVQNPYYADPNVVDSTVVASENTLADLAVPVMAVGGILMMMKS